MRYTIGIDVGGTNVKAGLVDEQSRLLCRLSIETQAEGGFEHAFARIAGVVPALLSEAAIAKSDLHAIGIGVPGPMSHARGIIFGAPNLPGWINVPMRDRMMAATGLPVVLENDANAAAFGEFTAGAGRDVRDMVMLTLGTGIGGGVVLDGRLVRGAFDNAGEVGHTVIQPDGRPCPCGQRGCLERYSSASAIAERLIEAVRAGEASALGARISAGECLDATDVEQAALAGDALARRVWDEACRYLALACVNIQHVLNPQIIVLAGGLINAGERLLEPVRLHFKIQTWRIAPDQPQIELATLGGDAGVIGAALLARIGSQPPPN